MPGPQQYAFPPPPPPPGQPPASQHPLPQYGYTQQTGPYQQHQRGGGGVGRGGRGGNQGGRGDYHGASPYNTQMSGGAYDPRHPQQSQAPGPPAGFNGPNAQQMAPPFTGSPPGPPPQQGAGGAYHWQSNQHNVHHGPPQQHPPQPPMHQNPPHPTPISVQNYHPNYVPQPYQQPQYGPHQHPPFQAQPPYVHNIPPNQPLHIAPPQILPQQHWQGPPLQNRHSFNGHRGRGGFNNVGRNSNDPPAPLMGPPIRMGFDKDRGGSHVTQASHGFPPPHINHHSSTPFPQTSFPGCPEFFPAGQRPSIDSIPYNSQRGRGHENLNHKGKGRGDFQHHQFRVRNDNRHQNNIHKAAFDNLHKLPGGGLDANGKKKKKRKTNTLGLTPNSIDHEDSDDEVDDVDEEARLVTLLGPDTPQLPTDLEAWLAERKSRYPTKSRRDAAAEQRRLIREQNREKKKRKDHGDKTKKEEGETKLERQQRKAEKLRLELEKAERKIQQEISGSKRKRENGDEGDEDRGQASDEDSESSSSTDSDDKPDIFSSRSVSRSDTSMRLLPPKAQLQRHCKYFSTGGTCGKKGKCRFVHDQEVRNQALRDKEANGGKMTLAQRLILNDTAKDDLTILKSIKYLKEKGLMPEQLTGSAPRYDDEMQISSTEEDHAENSNYGDN
ncbi:hypothetical protein K3495_g5240 [Podosphaera aphanis]|nr:hypothetical protein K3495_g5240 [Podosphaera aphanis]